jgi:alpha-1,3-rhamnosyl/mannosyltransferase
VLAVSERTKRDAVELYGLAPEKITVTPHGVDPAFGPGDGARPGYLLFVGAVQARKDPLAALAAAHAAGLPLVVVGPEKEPALARELRAGGADLRGWLEKDELAELYRGAEALLLPSRFEGFGIPVLEAMASGTPVVVSDDPALLEVTGDAAAPSVEDALSHRERYRALGLDRAKGFSWEETARRTADVYRQVLA